MRRRAARCPTTLRMVHADVTLPSAAACAGSLAGAVFRSAPARARTPRTLRAAPARLVTNRRELTARGSCASRSRRDSRAQMRDSLREIVADM
jgi:hypothetical protein